MLAAARTRDPARVREVLTGQRGFLLRELRNLEALRRRPGVDPVAGLLLTAATQHLNADLAFLDLAEERPLGDGAAALAELTGPAIPRPAGGSASAAS